MAVTEFNPVIDAPAATTSSTTKAITAAALGTVFEWYEFTLYAAMAGVIAAKFFSGLDSSVGYVFTLLTFGAGFVVRPFGALVFGRLGDRVGRKKTFLITIVIMGLATFAVGLLPVYSTVGIIAPILLVSLRILQGLALGGEYGGAVIYVTEHVDKKRRGLSTSFIQMTGTLGFLMALLSIQLVQSLASKEAFDAWAWRIPFLVSIVLLMVSVRIRLKMHESPVFKKMAAQNRLSKAPVSEAFGNWRNVKLMIVALIGIGGGISVVYYNAVTYPLFFLTKTLGVAQPVANLIVSVAALGAIPMFWLAGWLSDRYGRKPVILAGFTLGLVATFPVFHEIGRIANPTLIVALDRTRVVIETDPQDCSFMFNPLGNRKFISACDVARQKLAAASVNYELVPHQGSQSTQVRVGDRALTIDATQAFDKNRFEEDLKGALTYAGFGAAANPSGFDQVKIIGLLLLLLLAMALGYSPAGVAMAEMFPARIRYTAMSFPYHLATGWIGGLLPTFAFAIAIAQGDIFAGLWYTIGWLVVGIVITGLFYREPGADVE